MGICVYAVLFRGRLYRVPAFVYRLWSWLFT